MNLKGIEVFAALLERGRQPSNSGRLQFVTSASEHVLQEIFDKCYDKSSVLGTMRRTTGTNYTSFIYWAISGSKLTTEHGKCCQNDLRSI